MSRLTDSNLEFDSLRLEGALFFADHLARVAHGRAAGQKPADYGIPAGLKLRDEIGRAFRIGQALWQQFEADRGRADLDDHTAAENLVTRLLSQAFGFVDLAACAAQDLAGRSFPITHMARGCVPLVVAPHTLDPDRGDPRFGTDGRRRSGFRLLQEFLNASEASLWGIASNGLRLRLLRDNASLTRPAYLEVDVERLFNADSFADFSALWLILHASRFPQGGEPPAECILEQWRAAAREEGARARDRLRDGVTQALLLLGEGFVAHPPNQALREHLQNGQLSKDAYFQQLLRLVYRLIFWFTTEDRGLLHPPGADAAAVALYRQGYAAGSLRRRALRAAGFDRHQDVWHGLRIVFAGLNKGQPALGLPALAGLFASGQCADLDTAELPNRVLLGAVRQLAWFRHEQVLTPVNYRDMGPEELGSIYESLLELEPELDLANRRFGFPGLENGGVRGSARKLTGSYYTPDALVQELLKTTLEPVIEQTVAEHPAEPVAALLRLSVLDPAVGSGHFLLAAARHIADRVAALRAADGNPGPEDYRQALREVVTHCLYGVDRNPMALELARTALWLEAFTPEAPLSFLDHHLVCGDALVGLADFSVLSSGIPKEAYKALSGDDKESCKALAAANKQENASWQRSQTREQHNLDFHSQPACELLQALDAADDDSLEALARKSELFTALQAQTTESPLAIAADLYMAAFLSPKQPGASVPTTGDVARVLLGDEPPDELLASARAVCAEARVLHWPLAFAQIMARGGFDVVLGNPPWERIKLQEQEYFATRAPDIAAARNKAARGRAIALLAQAEAGTAERQLYDEFQQAKHQADAISAFAHTPARFPLTGVGDLNTYALFAETGYRLVANQGRAGMVLPTGIATDDSTKAFFGEVSQNARLVALHDFENRHAIFPGVHRSYKFCLLTLGQADAAEFSFYSTDIDQLADPRRRFALTPEELRRLNPNTRTCPVFRSQADAELTRKIYANVPVLWEETLTNADGDILQEEANPWGLRFQRMFDMSTDSGLFTSVLSPDRLPLYEAKMIHQFDHRWSGYGEGDNPVVIEPGVAQKADPAFAVRPRYWAERRAVLARLSNLPDMLLQAVRGNDGELLALGLAVMLFHEYAERESHGNIERLHANLYPLWRAFVAVQPFARPLSPVCLGLMGNNPPLLRRAGDSQLPAAPIDEIDATEREATAWYDSDPGLLETHLANLQPWFDLLTDPPRLETMADLWAYVDDLLDATSPRWLIGWRRNARATDERTMIAACMPRNSVGDSIFLMHSDHPTPTTTLLLAALNSLSYDFVARQKVGGVNFSFYLINQIAIPEPNQFTTSDYDFIVPRVLELTYTSHDLKPFYDEIIAENSAWDPRSATERGQPFAWELGRRALLRAELDAWYARLFGLNREELRYILDPEDVMGEDYPSETFRVLKNREQREFGEYRTGRLVLAAWDRLFGDHAAAVVARA